MAGRPDDFLLDDATEKMRIAFISYEYPPDTADGGIATYVFQAARMLRARGHDVEVFAGSRQHEDVFDDQGVRVERLREEDRHVFVERIGAAFARRHAERVFDVLEGPDCWAEAREAVRLVPDIPLVVKLHTPAFLVCRMNRPAITKARRLRVWAGAVRRGDKPYWHYDASADADRDHALEADEIAAPSHAVWEAVNREWGLGAVPVSFFPLPFSPRADFLSIPPGGTGEASGTTATFLGRLEARKGVLELAKAIPFVLAAVPQSRFRFVGKSMGSPEHGKDMRTYLGEQLAEFGPRVEFQDPVSAAGVPDVLRQADVCVFPSQWESFGLVALEAMAAARPVVTSNQGGMAEILQHGKLGRVVNVMRPRQLAGAIVELLNDAALRRQLGEAGRAEVLKNYGPAAVAPQQEASYARAIARRKAIGPRNTPALVKA